MHCDFPAGRAPLSHESLGAPKPGGSLNQESRHAARAAVRSVVTRRGPLRRDYESRQTARASERHSPGVPCAVRGQRALGRWGRRARAEGQASLAPAASGPRSATGCRGDPPRAKSGLRGRDLCPRGASPRPAGRRGGDRSGPRPCPAAFLLTPHLVSPGSPPPSVPRCLPATPRVPRPPRCLPPRCPPIVPRPPPPPLAVPARLPAVPVVPPAIPPIPPIARGAWTCAEPTGKEAGGSSGFGLRTRTSPPPPAGWAVSRRPLEPSGTVRNRKSKLHTGRGGKHRLQPKWSAPEAAERPCKTGSQLVERRTNGQTLRGLTRGKGGKLW